MDIARLEAHSGEGLPFRVNLEAVNKGVGLVALGLPFALLAVGLLGNTCAGIDSISHYYYSRLGGDLLVGALSFIGTLLLFFYKLPASPGGATVAVDGYLGHGRWDMRAARFAGLCAFGVALAPTSGTGCEDFAGRTARLFLTGVEGGESRQPVAGVPSFDFWATLGVGDSVLDFVHYGSALGMFLVLAYFSLVVFTRPQSATAVTAGGAEKDRKKLRNRAYRICGALILVAVAALAIKFLVLDAEGPFALEAARERLAWWNGLNLTFWFEALGLVAFGVSWSLKGRVFDAVRDRGEPNPKTLAAAQAAS